jgi:hypothetical protein
LAQQPLLPPTARDSTPNKAVVISANPADKPNGTMLGDHLLAKPKRCMQRRPTLASHSPGVVGSGCVNAGAQHRAGWDDLQMAFWASSFLVNRETPSSVRWFSVDAKGTGQTDTEMPTECARPLKSLRRLAPARRREGASPRVACSAGGGISGGWRVSGRSRAGLLRTKGCQSS